MREILFRGKMEDGGEWMYGDLVAGKFICVCDETIDENPRIGFIDVVNKTIGQYTGIDDVNGTKIFEGDIVHGNVDWSSCGMFEEDVVEIQFAETVGGYQWLCFDLDTIEVVGNIHDNPELIKEVENDD